LPVPDSIAKRRFKLHGAERAEMETYEWFLLGMLVACAPGLVVLALMLAYARRMKNQEANGDH
jgi:hypothetical protein